MTSKILTALRAVEWLPGNEPHEQELWCPICRGDKDGPDAGHAPDCIMAEAIVEAEQLASQRLWEGIAAAPVCTEVEVRVLAPPLVRRATKDMGGVWRDETGQVIEPASFREIG